MPKEKGFDITKSVRAGCGGIGFYKQGLPYGHFWLETWGRSGLLHGLVDIEDHTLSGDRILFMFGDFETIFYGKFHDRRMISARWVKLEFDTFQNMYIVQQCTVSPHEENLS